jgi:uncharacterized protein YbjT (DUF2867 family)
VDKPRIFLGSSVKQGKLLQAMTRGHALADIAIAEPRNGTIELAGPEQIHFEELVRQFLSATRDPRLSIRERHFGEKSFSGLTNLQTKESDDWHNEKFFHSTLPRNIVIDAFGSKKIALCER